ncbi:MAG: AGE family epimerase/isomerase [Balneolaceae bacterium]|nr:AGE family epimerase/isomerase [Balneolaceae bacterium]
MLMKEDLLKFYKDHLVDEFIPFWSNSLDQKHGGVFTCYDNLGKNLVSTDKYTWSQGRFLWLWSRIARMILENKLPGMVEEYQFHLEKTVSFIEKNVFLENGNCAFLLTADGRKKESIPGKGYDTSIYADCFIVLGLSEYAALKCDKQLFEKALTLYKSIRNRVEIGSIRSEPYEIPEGFKAHSIPMILLNVTQCLFNTSQIINHSKQDLIREYKIGYMQQIMNVFYQDDHKIAEFIQMNPSTSSNSLLERHINPGHAIESMGFVLQSAQEEKHSNYILKAVSAIEKAVNVGWDSRYGGILRFTDDSGTEPTCEKPDFSYEKLILESWDLKLWWPHSEALYATYFAYHLTGSEKMHKLFKKIHDYTFKTFPNPDKKIGEWIQIRDRKGKPKETIAALPVKDPFHIMRNLLQMIELLTSNQNK